MKYVKYLCIGCGAIVVCFIVLIAIISYAIADFSLSAPESVEYRNAEDLHRISGVQFPEVKLVDSITYESFSVKITTIKFILSDSSSKSEVLERIIRVADEDSTNWTVRGGLYKYDSNIKQLEDGVLHDGKRDFIDITLSEDNDTIELRYGTNYM